MAIVQLSSTNEQFSFALKKNPETGMIVKALRQGMMFGWYDNPQTYNLYFRENEGTCSFSKEPNYLDILQYASTYPIFQGIALFFNHLLKKNTEACEGTHCIYLPCIQTNAKKLVYLAKFLDLNIELTELRQGIFEFRAEFVGELSLFLMKVFVLFYLDQASGYNGVIFFDQLTQKVAKILKEINAPYFLRYYLSRTAIFSEKMFKSVKADLESSETEQLSLCFGNTQKQREYAIANLFKFDKSIVDVGCGEGNYTLPYAKKLSKIDKGVFAIDIDPNRIQYISDKAETVHATNITCFDQLDSFLATYNQEKVDVLLTEVIEHMPKEQAEILITQILTQINFDTVVITTPDSAFNQFYQLEGFRHPDHDWEMDANEFKFWMNTILSKLPKAIASKCNSKYVGIGDSVNGIYTSQGIVITCEDKETK